ncbi:hypothetical protein GCM10009797_29310 [Nocardioides hwasunensis]
MGSGRDQREQQDGDDQDARAHEDGAGGLGTIDHADELHGTSPTLCVAPERLLIRSRCVVTGLLLTEESLCPKPKV